MSDATGPPAGSPGLSTIGQIALTVSDIGRAIAFYRDKLGLTFLFEVPNLGFFDCGGVRLMLSGSGKPADGDSSAVYFSVADIQSACQALKARGVAFEREPHLVARLSDSYLWMAFFRDPDHNLLAVMSETPKQ